MSETIRIPRCQASTEKRDAYRYSGKGKTGFTLRFTHPQCTRRSIGGSDYCRQHTTGRCFPVRSGLARPYIEGKGNE